METTLLILLPSWQCSRVVVLRWYRQGNENEKDDDTKRDDGGVSGAQSVAEGGRLKAK